MTTSEQRLTRLEAVYEHLATKADIADLRTEMKSGIGDLRSEMKADIGRLESQTANLRAEIYRINATLIRWLVSLMAGSLVIGLGSHYRHLQILRIGPSPPDPVPSSPLSTLYANAAIAAPIGGATQ